MAHLFCYGFGYSAQALARRLEAGGRFEVSGSTRSNLRADGLHAPGRSILVNDGTGTDELVAEALGRTTHLLVSASPDASGDPVLRHYGDVLRGSSQLKWVGYLSTIGVYGDQNNAWVSEETPVAPLSERAKRRVDAENEWLAFGEQTGVRLQVFRLAGIYGPGRSVIDKLKSGTARRIDKPGQVFNRIHVEDIGSVLGAAVSGAGTRSIYNVSDNEPAPPQDVVAFGADLLGLEAPPLIAFEDADLSAMGRSFYQEQRRMRNDLIASDLGVELQYPTYREGLRSIVDGA